MLKQFADPQAVRSSDLDESNSSTGLRGIASSEQISELDTLRIDAVVGMAIYTGQLKFTHQRKSESNFLG